MPEDPASTPADLPEHAEYLEEVNMWITPHPTSSKDAISEPSVTRTKSDVTLQDTYSYRQWPLEVLPFEGAFSYAEKAENTVTVAVIDSGISAVHPDLKRKIRKDGYNFINNNTNTADSNGHGTQVAGTIAATAGNNLGITGYTGTYDVDILPIKIMDEDGKGSSSDIIRAVNFALEKNVDVINLSLGSKTFSSTEERTMETAADKGVIIIASAGNEGSSSRFYPASHDSVFSIGSHSERMTHSDFSNYNSNIDFSAPGEYIYTTKSDGSYSYKSGTSFSAPVFASIVAMMKSLDPSLQGNEIKNLMQLAALDLGSAGKDNYFGYGTVLPGPAIREVLFDEFGSSRNVSTDKTWTVEFNKAIRPSSVEGNVYVTDERGNKERVNITYAEDSIEIHPPFFGYERNSSYTLYVEDNVLTENGEKINNSVQQDFLVR